MFIKYAQQPNTAKRLDSECIWIPFADNGPARKPDSNSIIFAHIHGNVDIATKQRVLEVFNSEANKHGDLITVLTLSKSSVEGVNIHHLRALHILESQWDFRDVE